MGVGVMFCQKCGTELPDSANFCSHCGEPQNGSLSQGAPKWETYQIEHQYVKLGRFGGRGLKFVAKVIGPSGTHIAAESPAVKMGGGVLPNIMRKDDMEAFENLMSRLLALGWERTGQKVNPNLFHSEILRRRVG
jgi:hypothetical protein